MPVASMSLAELPASVQSPSQHTLRRRNIPRIRIHACRHPQRPRRRLEDRLRNVMLIPAVQILDVQVELAFLHERLQELLDQFRLQIPDPRHLELRLVDQVRPSRKIHNHSRQRLIQRNIGMSESRDSAPIAERFVQRLAKNPAHIFHRVMPVDLQIAFRL